MGDRFAAVGIGTPAASPGITCLALHPSGVGAKRGHVYDMGWGATGAPADNSTEWEILRSITNNGTASVVTEEQIDSDSPETPDCTATQTFTVEPTGYGTPLISIGLNQRASWRWVAAPEGELIVPSVALGALGIVGTQASGGVVTSAYMNWRE